MVSATIDIVITEEYVVATVEQWNVRWMGEVLGAVLRRHVVVPVLETITQYVAHTWIIALTISYLSLLLL